MKVVKIKVMYLFQAWGLKFQMDRDLHPYAYIFNAYKVMKEKGFSFPPVGVVDNSLTEANNFGFADKKKDANMAAYYVR